MRHTVLKAGIIFFHGLMNSRVVVFLGRGPFLHRIVAKYRALADLNKERMDMLEFLCDIVDVPSDHLQKRHDFETLELMDASKDLVQQHADVWIECEAARWTKYFQPPPADPSEAIDYRSVTPGTEEDEFSAKQKSVERAVAKILGVYLGTEKELEYNAQEDIGYPWVYAVALSSAFQNAINRKVIQAAWTQILSTLEDLHAPAGTVSVGDGSRLHLEIWTVMKKIMEFSPKAALSLSHDLKNHCSTRNWPYFPFVNSPPKQELA